jgi:hypothetical protein
VEFPNNEGTDRLPEGKPEPNVLITLYDKAFSREPHSEQYRSRHCAISVKEGKVWHFKCVAVLLTDIKNRRVNRTHGFLIS